MGPTSGLYSLIQYVPDAERAEGINVGVVVICPAHNAIAVRINDAHLKTNRRVLAGGASLKALSRAANSLVARLLSSRPTTRNTLVDFASCEAGVLQLLAPRPHLFTTAEVEMEADELEARLVSVVRSVQPRLRLPNISPVLDPLEYEVQLLRDQEVIVPIMQRKLRVPYAFVSEGAVQLLWPRVFPRGIEDAVQSASAIGAMGRLLARHPANDHPSRLVVVGHFDSDTVRDRVSSVLTDMDTGVYDARRLLDMANDVRQKAPRRRDLGPPPPLRLDPAGS